MKEFMADIEEDPEMREKISLYKDEDVVDQLEKQLAQMSLNDKPKSPLETA